MRILFVAVIASLLVSVAGAAEKFVHVERLSTMDGLSNNFVRCIYQDSKGFVWMGTRNGLCRYDGYSFLNFMPGNGDGPSLGDRNVKGLHEDANGFLWVSLSDMISCYDMRHNRFVDFTGCGEYRQKYTSIAFLDDGVWMWGKYTGCRRVTYSGGRFSSQSFSVAGGQLRSNEVFKVHQASGGAVYVCTSDGLYEYGRHRGRLCPAGASRF